jgi:hypothetical protein
MGGDMGAPLGGFMSSIVAPIPLSSGAVGASLRGAMGSYMSNEEVQKMEMKMEEKMRRDARLRYFYPLCHMFVLNFFII